MTRMAKIEGGREKGETGRGRRVGRAKGERKEVDEVEATTNLVAGPRGRQGEKRSGLDFLSFCNF